MRHIMKQIVWIVLSLSFFKAFSDPGHGLEANYNGRTFPCKNYNNAKRNMEEFGSAGGYYNYAFCQIHRGELSGGIASFEIAAGMGDHTAAILLADYHISDHYNLEETTQNLANLQRTIDYYKQALQIMSQPGYPSDSDSLRMEKIEPYYLDTANDLVGAYRKQFALRYNDHIADLSSRSDRSALESLQDMQAAAESCLAIPYRGDLWSRSTYNKRMAYCQASRNVLRDHSSDRKGLFSLERERLRIATTNCRRSFKLSDCPKHKAIDLQIEDFYMAHLKVVNTLMTSR